MADISTHPGTARSAGGTARCVADCSLLRALLASTRSAHGHRHCRPPHALHMGTVQAYGSTCSAIGT
eukprot:scaffold48114_cov23-Tisochrysis_lutea.AAC.1